MSAAEHDPNPPPKKDNNSLIEIAVLIHTFFHFLIAFSSSNKNIEQVLLVLTSCKDM